jgi:hypothetical protein
MLASGAGRRAGRSSHGSRSLASDAGTAGDADLDPGVLALAHLGAAVALFQRYDIEMAAALMAAVESALGTPPRLA